MATKSIQIPEIVVPGKRLGRHVEHDPRSRSFAAEPDSVIKITSVSHRRYGSILDQDIPKPLGSCTGNAAAGAINSTPIHKKGVTLKEPDAVKLYELATTLDEFDGSYPPDDTGSSGLAVSKAAMKMGYISGYKHAFSTTNALRALMLTTLIMGINWYETMDYPNPDNGKVEVYGEIRGGHEVQIKGFHESTTSDPYDGLLECCNSWGKGWGKNGKFYLTVHDYERLMGEDGDTTILMK